MAAAAGALAVTCLLGGCGTAGGGKTSGDGLPVAMRDVSSIPDAQPQPEPRARHGNMASYVVFGQRYYTKDTSSGFVQRGIASWYGKKFHGRKTSSGEVYDMWKMTAAHKTLPLPTYVRVTRLDDGRSVVVKVNDRGPFHEGRVIDLSLAAALKLGVVESGVAEVEVVALEPESSLRQRVAAKPPRNLQPSPLPAPQSAPVPAPSTRYYVQVGAYGLATNATAHRDRLRRAGYTNAAVETNSRGTLHFVRTGPFASRAEAQAHVAALDPREQGAAALVVR